jgi:quercetin dioxygenase-like cupin family protein
MFGCLLTAVAAAGWGIAEQPQRQAATSEQPPMTIQSLEQVEPQQYPWGWIRWLINSETDPDAEMTFGMVYIKPGQENPLHQHPNSAEYLHVLEGSCQHLVGSQWADLKAGDTIRIPRNVRHRARTTTEACRVIVVYNTGKRQMVTLDEADHAEKSETEGRRQTADAP